MTDFEIVAQVLMLAGPHATLNLNRKEPWGSRTVTGTRHDFTITFAGPAGAEAGEAFIAALPDHEFSIPRALVADAAVVGVAHYAPPGASPTLAVEAVLLLINDYE